MRTLGQIFTKNAPMSQSTFIKERYYRSLYDKFDRGMIDNTKKFAVWITGVLDEVGTKFIWNSHYEKALAENITNPIKYADDMTRSLVAGRGIGEVPLIQKSKIFQMVAPFQLEVGNTWWIMEDFIKAKDATGLITFFVASYLMNEVAKKIRGNNVVFDPINALVEGIGILQNEEDKKEGALKMAGRMGGEALSNIPLGQTVAAAYPEYGMWGLPSRKEFFGSEDPTRFGSGILASKALQDPYKTLPSFGGGQLKKTIQGFQSLQQGGSYDKAGKLQFKQGATIPEAAQALAFGKYASSEAQQYFKTGKSPETLNAEKLFADLKGKPKEEIKQRLLQEVKNDPKIIERLKAIVKDKSLNDEEKKIKAMGVENGARAHYILEKIKKLPDKKAKIEYVINLYKKGLLSSEVIKTIIEQLNH